MCITNPLKISDFQGNLLHMLLFSQKHAFYFSILRIKEGLSHVQQPLLKDESRFPQTVEVAIGVDRFDLIALAESEADLRLFAGMQFLMIVSY